MIVQNETELLSLIECIRNSQSSKRRQELRANIFSPNPNESSVNYWHLRVLFERGWGFEWKDKLGEASCIKLLVREVGRGWVVRPWECLDFEFAETIIQSARDFFKGDVAP